CITAAVLASGVGKGCRARARPGAFISRGHMVHDDAWLASLGAAGAKAAVLEPVAARGHVAPRTLPAVRPVVERPETVRVTAQLHPVPAAVGLRVADGQQQPGQTVGQALSVWTALHLDLALGGHLEP